MINYDRLCKRLKIQVTKETDEWIRARCPFPEHLDNQASFGINIRDGFYKCFVCGAGSLETLVMKLLGLSYMDAKDFLIDKCGIDEAALQKYISELGKKKEHRVRHLSEHVLRLYPRNILRMRYLFQRRFTYEIIEKLEIGYDILSKRVTFPIRDINGRLVGILGRDVTDSAPTRWKVYFNFDKSEHLYNGHNVMPGAPLTITEGPTDIARALQFGFNNIVGIMTSKPSRRQIDLIRELNPSSITLAMDPDTAGQVGEAFLIRELVDEFPIFRINRKGFEEKDLGDMTGDEMVKAFTRRSNVVMDKLVKLAAKEPKLF